MLLKRVWSRNAWFFGTIVYLALNFGFLALITTLMGIDLSTISMDNIPDIMPSLYATIGLFLIGFLNLIAFLCYDPGFLDKKEIKDKDNIIYQITKEMDDRSADKLT